MKQYTSTHEWLNDLRSDFKLFLAYLWSELDLPAPTKIQLEIADYLQHGGDRIGIMAFRGIGKSWITAAYVLWSLLLNPNERVLVLSATGQRAYDFGTFCFQLIEKIPLLRHLKPNDNQKSSKINFDVGPSDPHQAASVRSVGITGQITGGRASLIIADDLETPGNIITEEARERLVLLSNEFESILMTPTEDIKPRIVYLGTPQISESIYIKKASMNFKFRIWPARCPADLTPYRDPKDDTRSLLAPTILDVDETQKGKPTDPERFDEIELMKRESGYSAEEFQLQFMLNTMMSDANKFPLKTKDIIVCEGLLDDLTRGPIDVRFGGEEDNSIPNIGLSGDRFRKAKHSSIELSKYDAKVMSIDPSGRGKDETAYAITGLNKGKIFILAVGGFTDGYSEETLQGLAGIAKTYEVNTIEIEANFGDGMFTSIFKPILRTHHKCLVEEVRNNKQKEARMMDTLLPPIKQHRVIVDREVILQDLTMAQKALSRSWIYQLTHLSRDRGCLKHDDRLDALSMAIGYHTRSLEVSEKEAQNVHREHQVREYVEVFRRREPKRFETLSALHGWDVKGSKRKRRR